MSALRTRGALALKNLALRRDRLAGMGIEEALSAPHSPWQNPFVECLIGSVRRECLDHMIVLGQRHLRRILAPYFAYYHRSRTHLSISKDAPRVARGDVARDRRSGRAARGRRLAPPVRASRRLTAPGVSEPQPLLSHTAPSARGSPSSGTRSGPSDNRDPTSSVCSGRLFQQPAGRDALAPIVECRAIAYAASWPQPIKSQGQPVIPVTKTTSSLKSPSFPKSVLVAVPSSKAK